MKLIQVQTDESGDGIIPMEEFSNFLDITRVEFYRLEVLAEGVLVVHFFDKEFNPVVPNAENEKL